MNTVAKKIIEFWKFVEILQTKNFNPKNTKTKNRNCYIININNKNDLKNLTDENKNGSDYDICCYSIKKSDIEEYFIKEKELTEENRLEISNDNICLFGFQVDKDFNYNQKKPSFYFSPYIWYLDELINNHETSFENYKKFINTVENEIIKNILIDNKKNLLEKIKDLKNVIVDNIKLLENLKINDCIAAYYSSTNEDTFINHESQLFNSYIIDDLELVSERYGNNENVVKYILSLKKYKKKKVNVKTDKEEIKRILSKEKYPLGKWPSKYYPSLMQQMAINYAIDKNENPIFSVNGPPGTGKTTLLKEIIADTIVKRAIEISFLSSANDAFKEVNVEDITYYKVNKIFLPFSILVASCNNAAVENITKELPENKKLLEELKENREYSDFFDLSCANEKISYKINNGKTITDTYFNQLETNLYNCKANSKISENDVWGIISAPLGKKSNIENFFDTVISGYLNLMDDKLIEERNKEKIFNEAKEDFRNQLNIVKDKLDKLVPNVTEQYLNRIQKSYTKEGDKNVQTERPSNINEEFDIEREKLFCKAINLQKAFVLTSSCLSKNLSLLEKCLIWGKGNLTSDQKNEIFTDTFLSLFFLVPVVSSTFASIQRMLKYMNDAKKIGILIIDEAGQATPQQALGAIYRSKKCIVVGDPMQVEPVVTTSPEVYEDFLVNNISSKVVDYATSIKSESVQTFSDRLNPFGSYIEQKSSNKKTWVGCPLIVHRRCTNPMFEISNELSYDNTMINATKGKDSTFLLKESCWIDVSGREKGDKDHFVQEQFDVVEQLLKQKEENNDSNIFIITPFVSVKTGLQKFNNLKVGTVHTFQGKEAEEVILVLGCDEKAMGAVNWVNANIINVAVTRAKNRLYVVGDWDLWSSNPNVAVMQKYLERKNITDLVSNKKEKKNMAEEIKEDLISIADRIISMEKDAYEKGRNSVLKEVAEKMKTEKIKSQVIKKITGVEVNYQNEYEDFTKKYSKEISVTFNKEWANFTIKEQKQEEEKYGWNMKYDFFAKGVNTEYDFVKDFNNLLSSLDEEEIREYWGKSEEN